MSFFIYLFWYEGRAACALTFLPWQTSIKKTNIIFVQSSKVSNVNEYEYGSFEIDTLKVNIIK